MRMKRIYIDMDGVLCDYKSHWMKKKEENPGMPYPQSQYGFFLELEPLPRAIESVKILQEFYDVWILTAPSYKNPMCLAEKNYWLSKYFGPEFPYRMITCSDKSLVKGDYLIDDNTHMGQEGFEGKLMRFGTEYPDWVSVMNELFLPLSLQK